jgi:hypothetical protein
MTGRDIHKICTMKKAVWYYEFRFGGWNGLINYSNHPALEGKLELCSPQKSCQRCKVAQINKLILSIVIYSFSSLSLLLIHKCWHPCNTRVMAIFPHVRTGYGWINLFVHDTLHVSLALAPFWRSHGAPSLSLAAVSLPPSHPFEAMTRLQTNLSCRSIYHSHYVSFIDVAAITYWHAWTWSCVSACIEGCCRLRFD